jgi:hypothetical protein
VQAGRGCHRSFVVAAADERYGAVASGFRPAALLCCCAWSGSSSGYLTGQARNGTWPCRTARGDTDGDLLAGSRTGAAQLQLCLLRPCLVGLIGDDPNLHSTRFCTVAFRLYL